MPSEIDRKLEHLYHWLLSPLVESFLQGLCMFMGARVVKSLGQRTKRCLLACLRWDHVGGGRTEDTWKSPLQIQLPLVVSQGVEL